MMGKNKKMQDVVNEARDRARAESGDAELFDSVADEVERKKTILSKMPRELSDLVGAMALMGLQIHDREAHDELLRAIAEGARQGMEAKRNQ